MPPTTRGVNVTGSVVVADDSGVTRAIVARELRAAGWHVREATNGAEAVELCRAHRPDVALFDIDMPRLTGFEALAAIQAVPALADLPVIFLTARDSAEDVAEGLRRGAHDYLRKPVDATELLARMSLAQRMQALQAELRALATTDGLTGLDNRRAISARFEAATGPVAAILLDVDHFKRVNDVHGHAAGDDVLREVAQRVRAGLRPDDACGRWGGEEFLCLLDGVAMPRAVLVAEALRTRVSDAPVGPGLRVTVSIGVAVGDPESPEALVARADEALYAAKAAGRDRVRIAAPAPAGAAQPV